MLLNFRNIFRNHWFPMVTTLVGLLFLIGRYDWSNEGFSFSLRSYKLSAYFFILLVPSVYYLLKIYSKNPRVPTYFTGLLAAIFSCPYQWLGLSKFFLHSRISCFYTAWNAAGQPLPETNWFPAALRSLPVIPGEGTVFALIFLLGGAGIYGLVKKGYVPRDKKILFRVATLSGIFFIIVLQTWLHLSLRSPYTYVPHYEQPASNHYWYHYNLFEGAQGAVNMDYPVFRDAEEVFIGVKKDFAILQTRPFPFYLSSQITAFVNPYYVWLFINIFMWCLGVYAIYYLGSQRFSEKVGLYSAWLFASAQGPILYVAQPKMYTFAIASVVIMVALYYSLFTRKDFNFGHSILFGIFLGFCQLCYEGQPWLIGFALLALVLRLNLKWTIVSAAIALAIFTGFLRLCEHVPHLISRPALAGNDPIQTILETLKSHNYSKWWRLLVSTERGFRTNMRHAFNISLLMSFLGLFLVPKKNRWLLLALCVPAFLTYAVFELGESFYVLFPRLVYSAYPAVYLSCSVVMALAAEKLKPRFAPSLGKGLAILFIIVHFVHANVDVFGYPSIYYYWFNRNPAYAEP